MLLPEMTPGAERAILATLAWQQACQTDQVEPLQMLLGLMHDDESRPVAIMNQLGITREMILSQHAMEAAEISPAFELPAVIDNRVQKWLYDARHLALEHSGSPQVHSEHLLMAVLNSAMELKTALENKGYDHHQLLKLLGMEAKPALILEVPLKLTEDSETASLARILDANANRAREALRILEELCRFHLNDAFLTQQAKVLRHGLTQSLADYLSRNMLIRHRDTEGDVGTAISTIAEEHRQSLKAVLRANAQRLQEALRALEEYGKVVSPAFGRAIEKLRYRSYSLERALVTGDRSRELLAKAHLYLLVSKGSCSASLVWTIEQAAKGGVSMVQLREKNKGDRELLNIAREVRSITRRLGLLFIMNDRPDLARLSQADGVHLGQDDLEVSSARSIIGSDALIGISTHSIKQLEKAILDGADYIGIGPVFSSQTKQFDELAGLEYLRQVASHTQLPAFALGGIGPDNVNEVVSAGIRRVAVGHAICQADDPEQTAKGISSKLLRNES